jgi:hypothetical protein
LNSIYAITTHHDRPSEAAEAWRELNVCAIGFTRFGKLTSAKPEELPKDVELFLRIKKGDLILAYAMGNRIAYVGEIENGKYMQTHENIVGLDKKDGGFGYPNQYKVKWYEKPRDFSRTDLPDFLRKQLGQRGRTVVPINLNRRSFDDVKQIILVCARSESLSYQINEDTVKAGIRKYLRRHINSLEEGMKIVKSEEPTSTADRPDFIARDKDGRIVLIECKGNAFPEDCRQLERYGEGLKKENPRLILVAFKVDDGCMKEAKSSRPMELVECDLTFKRVFPV